MTSWPLRKELVRELLPAFLAGLMLFAASLANFLEHNDYPLLRPENGLIVGAAALVCAVMALAHRALPQWLRSILEGFLTALFVDFNSDSLDLAVGVGAIVAAVTLWRRATLVGPMALIGGVVLVTTALGIRGDSSWVRTVTAEPAAVPAATDRPAILHLILDEHIGLTGLEELGTNGNEMARELRQSYLAAGFAVYGGAYSQHLRTVNALPHIFNFGGGKARAASTHGVRVGSTEYLRSLAQAGYRLNVWQADFADFCSDNPVTVCTTYDSSSMRPTLPLPLKPSERAAIILAKFVQLSQIAAMANSGWNSVAFRLRQSGLDVPRFQFKDNGRSSTVASLAVLELATRSLASAKPGEAYVLHMLLPHYPYVVGRDCKFRPWDEWKSRKLNAPLAVRQRAYIEQLRCTTTKVLTSIEAFRSSTGGKNGIVILHGDHGSRITDIDPSAENVGRFSDADLVAGFSTFFAVHAPQIAPVFHSGPQPVAMLLKDLSTSGFSATPRTDSARVGTVFLDDGLHWIPRREVPLPKSLSAAERPAGQ